MSTTEPSSHSVTEQQRELAAQGIKYVFAQFTDIHGAAKGKLIPLAYLSDIIHPGAGFSGPSIWGTGLPHQWPALRILWSRRSGDLAADAVVTRLCTGGTGWLCGG